MSTQLTMQALAQELKQQAASANEITLDDAVLQRTGVDQLISQFLSRSNLILTVAPQIIPDNPPSTGFTIPVNLPDAGSDSFLNLTGNDCSLQFVQGSTYIEFVLSVTLTSQHGKPITWVMSDSFDPTKTLLFDRLPLESPGFLFATYAVSSAVQPGLTLSSIVTLSGILADVPFLLAGSKDPVALPGDTTYTLSGLINQTQQGPAFSLKASLQLGSITLPFFGSSDAITIDSPYIGAQLQYVQNSDGTWSARQSLDVGTTIAITNSEGTSVSVDFLALLPLQSGLGMMNFAIVPSSGPVTSIADLGALIAGNSWNSFFTNPDAPGQKYLATFGLEQFVATVGLSPLSVSSLYLQAGISQPWPFFDNQFTVESFQIGWLIISPGQNPIMTAMIDAELEMFDDPDFSFDISIVLPALLLSGTYNGTATLHFSTIIEKVSSFFGTPLSLPDDFLTLSFSNLGTTMDIPNGVYTLSGTANLDLQLFGLELLGLRNTQFVITYSSKATPTVQGSVTGILTVAGLDFSVSAQFGQDMTFQIHLVNMTIGRMLNWMVHFVDPTYDITLDSPWNKLLDISLDAFVLEIDYTADASKRTVSLTYDIGSLDLIFLTLKDITLTYALESKAVSIELTADFLGQDNQSIKWDAINESPPAVPGQGSSFLDLQYLGLGQHIVLPDDPAKLTTVEDVIQAMIDSVIPLEGQPLPTFGPNGLHFSEDSTWLVGAQFTLLEGTIALSGVFQDNPTLYGLLISLAGERAKVFAGLKFEILYHKVTDTIGVYHIELKLPDAMRNLEFGEVSITLPVVILDIYTNGNFRIDLGFPVGLDFSNSFCLQIFPFIGYGGLYFALLDGATSNRVPQIDNGNFSPVIEFGVAVSLGVGKTIDEGILSGGISVTVTGIVEGCVGWFNPNDPSVAKEEYYWLQGTIEIVGKLYGTIDFGIIQANLSVVAYASVTLVIEAHQPIYISLVAGVSVKVSVKVVFFTIHLSFSAQVSASFTIGSASATPWHVVGDGTGGNARLRRLKGQASLHRPPAARFAGLGRVTRAARVQGRLAAGETLDWTPAPVFPDGKQQPVTITVLPPSFTKSDSGAVQGVLLLGAVNSVDPRAMTLADHRQLFGEDAPSAAFNLLLEGMLRWAIHACSATTTVTADDLAFLKQQLTQPDVTAAAFDYTTQLTRFFTLNFQFTLTPPPTSGDEQGAALFPVFPALTMTTNDSNKVDVNFGVVPAGQNGVDGTYVEKILAYLSLLQVQYMQGVAQSPENAQSSRSAAADGSGETMATVLFEQYFAMLASATVQAAVDLLTGYPFTSSASFGIQDVISGIGDPSIAPLQVVAPNQHAPVLNPGTRLTLNDVLYQVKQGDTLAGIAATLTAAGVQNLQAADVLNANLTASDIFSAGTTLTITTIPYTSQTGDTLNLIAARLLMRAALPAILQQLQNLTGFASQIQAANPGVQPDPATGLLPVGVALQIPNVAGGYTTVSGDTWTLVAAAFLAPQQGAVDFGTLVTSIQASNPNVEKVDPSTPLPPGTDITIPSLTRAIQTGDSVQSMASTLITTSTVIAAALLSVPSSTALLAPLAVLTLPPLSYAIKSGDTLAGISRAFNLTLEQLAVELAATKQLFAANASITVNDIEQVAIETLISALLEQGEWNNISGMVSRFLLNGLRLPDPNDPAFKQMSVQDLSNPAKRAEITTHAMYSLSGQQFPIDTTPPSDYAITLTSDGSSWLTMAGTSPNQVAITLTAGQLALLPEIASTAFAPAIDSLHRLPLYQLTPTRFTLQQHLQWQAAALPPLSSPSQAAGGPSLWPFPDSLITQLGSGATVALEYDLVVGTQQDPTVPMTTTELSSYGWGTVINLTVALPDTGSGAPPGSNIYAVVGADQTGTGLLLDLYEYLTSSTDTAAIYLLYPASPTSANPSGLLSDQIDQTNTFLLKTNLSVLSHSGPSTAAATGFTPQYSASIADARDFIKLLWECSVVQSGGYYLNYKSSNGGSGLPGYLFAQGGRATLSLLILLGTQTAPHAPLYAFNNTAVVGDNLDASQSNLFVQPLTTAVPIGHSLADLAATYNAENGTNLSPLDVATANQSSTSLLLTGATLQLPAGSVPETYTIASGDSLAGIASTYFNGSLSSLVGTAANAQAPILSPGAQSTLGQSTVTVPAGQSLSGIAAYHNATTGDSQTPVSLAELNASVVSLLLVNASLALPDGGSHTVVYGDTLAGIAARANVTVEALVAAGNNLVAPILAPGAQVQYARLPITATPGTSPSLIGVAVAYNQTHGTNLAALDIAAVNAGDPTILQPATVLQVPTGTYSIHAGDTLQSIAAASFSGNLAALVGFGGNASAAILQSTSQVQVVQALLAPASTVPQGTTGFQLSLQNPDPSNLPYDQLTPSQIVGSLFHLLGAEIPSNVAGFLPSGYALPAGPTTSDQDYSNGLTPSTVDAPAYTWQYQHSMAIAPFAAVAQDAGSQPLPPPGQDPYAGIGPQTSLTLGFQFQDIFGNQQPSPSPFSSLTVPVGYYTDIIALSRWPGLAAAYEIVASPAPQVQLQLAMQIDKYFPSPSIDVSTAQNRAAGDLASYTQIYYQLQQSDLTLALETSLDTTSLGSNPPVYPLDPTPFASFVNAAYVFLSALNTLKQAIYPLVSSEQVTSVCGDLYVTAQQLFAGNAQRYYADLFGSASLTVNGASVPPEPGETLAAYAARNNITMTDLAAQNGSATMIAGAQINIPYQVTNLNPQQCAFYLAGGTDTLQGIAGKFPSCTPEVLANLNETSPGLFLPEIKITDPTSQKSVTTATDSTFTSLLQAFAAEGVTLTIGQLAAIMAGQSPLLRAGGVWITPPMLAANVSSKGVQNTLNGLAARYNLDAQGLAQANAAVQGFLAAGISIPFGGKSVTVGQYDTLDSVLNRLAQQQVTVDLPALVTAIGDLPGLLNPASLVVPLPAAPAAGVPITPTFSSAYFPLTVDIVLRRDPACVDPDFASVTSVLEASTALNPELNPGAQPNTTLSLSDFATSFEQAFPGLHVATGTAVSEEDQAATRPIWIVNFGYGSGQKLSYQFHGDQAAFFAVPPLSTSLLSGNFSLQGYQDGKLDGTAKPATFQSIDLDVWAALFLQAMDLILSPPYAVPAYAIDAQTFEDIVTQKESLANSIKQQVQSILATAGTGSSLTDAQNALLQALLVQLSNDYGINSLVQVPVRVTAGGSDPTLAPRLSGKPIILPQTTADTQDTVIQDFSFSTTKVPLAVGDSTATFLFTVRSPATTRDAVLTLQYVVSELELPTPGIAPIDGYQASTWLSFVNPIANTDSFIGTLNIPVPLRSYPTPITLVAQSGNQSSPNPPLSSLPDWDYSCTYQHMDAAQDTTFLTVELNAQQENAALGGSIQALFAALAQFVAVYPQLKDDLALLPQLPFGTQNPVVAAALNTFDSLAQQIATAWAETTLPRAASARDLPAGVTYHYQLEKSTQQNNPSLLDTLTITALDTPPGPYPNVDVNVDGTWESLMAQLEPPGAPAVYQYPPDVQAGTSLQQRFTFTDLNAAQYQNGWAGLYLTRNAELLDTAVTNNAFIYQTPTVSFASPVVPSISSAAEIDLNTAPDPSLDHLAASLQSFFQQLLGSATSSSTSCTITIACSYCHAVATPVTAGRGIGDSPPPLESAVPILLVSNYPFDLATDWNTAVGDSVVNRLAASVKQYAIDPPGSNAAYVFDFSLFSSFSTTDLQPLIRATNVRYIVGGAA